MIDDLATWKSEWANLPLVSDDSWKQNIGDYLEARTLNMELPGLQGPGLTWSLSTDTFVAALAGVSAATGDGINQIAIGFESALLASTYSVSSGTSIGTPTPSTIWSAVSSTVVDPASVSAGKEKILELLSAPLVSKAEDSQFPIKLREAWLLLTITTSGSDSTPPPSGPIPLTDAARSVG